MSSAVIINAILLRPSGMANYKQYIISKTSSYFVDLLIQVEFNSIFCFYGHCVL